MTRDRVGPNERLVRSMRPAGSRTTLTPEDDIVKRKRRHPRAGITATPAAKAKAKARRRGDIAKASRKANRPR